MASFTDTLKADVQQALPGLSDADREKLLEFLQELAESEEELLVLTEADLKPQLKVGKARILLKFFQKKYGGQTEPNPSDAASQHGATSTVPGHVQVEGWLATSRAPGDLGAPTEDDISTITQITTIAEVPGELDSITVSSLSPKTSVLGENNAASKADQSVPKDVQMRDKDRGSAVGTSSNILRTNRSQKVETLSPLSIHSIESKVKCKQKKGSMQHKGYQRRPCSMITELKVETRLANPVTVHFVLVAPKACNDVRLCLHTPHAEDSYYVEMIRQPHTEKKFNTYRCEQEIQWKQVAFHYFAVGEKISVPLKDLIIDGDIDHSGLTQYHFDHAIPPSKSKVMLFGHVYNFFSGAHEKQRAKIVDGAIASIDWDDLDEWYLQLSALHTSTPWPSKYLDLKTDLFPKVTEKVQLLEDSSVQKKDRIRTALALISLDRKKIISLNQTQCNLVLQALQIASPDEAHIISHVRSRSFLNDLHEFLKDQSIAMPWDLTSLNCLPLLHLMDPDYESNQEMPPRWKKTFDQISAAAHEAATDDVLRQIRPTLSADRPTTLALLSMMRDDQTSLFSVEQIRTLYNEQALSPEVVLDVIAKIFPPQMSESVTNLFDAATTKIINSPQPKKLTENFRATTKRCKERMNHLGNENLDSRIQLTNCASKLVELAKYDKTAIGYLDEMFDTGIQRYLKDLKGSLDDTIKRINDVRNAHFTGVIKCVETIQQCLEKILSKIEPQERIVAFGQWKIQQHTDLHPDLQSTLRKHAKEAIVESLKGGEGGSVFAIRCCNDGTSAVYSEIFMESWIGHDPTRHLLSWQYMPNFLKAIGNGPLGKRRECIDKLEQTSSEVLKGISDGAITHDDMQMVLSKSELFKSITETTKIIDVKKLELILRSRKQQLEQLETYRTGLDDFEDRCHLGFHPVAMESLHQLATDDVKDRLMKDLFDAPPFSDVVNEDHWYSDIKAVNLPAVVIKTFPGLHKARGHVVFDNFFQNRWRSSEDPNEVTTSEMAKDVTMSDVAKDVISSSLNEWEQVCDDMTHSSIKLELVKVLFDKVGRDVWLDELTYMCGDRKKAKERLNQVKSYFDILQYQNATETIMNLQKTYSEQLSGNFDILLKATAKDASLASMAGNAERIVTGVGALNPQQLKWLDAYTDANPVVKWLQTELGNKKEVKTLLEMQFFTSSDHNDLDMTKANSLIKVVDAFSPLIYDLKPNAGLEELLDKFQEMWIKSASDEKLPQQLRDLGKNLRWLKDLKQMHSAAGRDALSKVEDIISSGIYKVGNLQKSTKLLDTMITVTVPEGKWKEEKYTFPELQNLQSTLVLVAGQNEKSKGNVQRFSEILNAVRGVAETFSKLCDNGNILFEGWTSEFHCDDNAPVNTFVDFGLSDAMLAGQKEEGKVLYHIKQIQDFMESCLTDWGKHIQEQREQFPVLNSFTTRQLVILRSELSKITEVGPKGIPDKIFPLLRMVLLGCTRDHLKEAWIETVKKMKSAEEDLPLDGNEASTKEAEVIKSLQRKGLHRDQILRAIKEKNTFDKTEIIAWCWKSENSAKEKGTVDSTAIQRDETHENIMTNIIKQVLQQSTALKDRLTSLWKQYLSTNTSKSLKDYLSVVHLGHMLTFLKAKSTVNTKREFPKFFRKGHPNMILCDEASVWRKVLSIYMTERKNPLPTKDEVLLCTSQTTAADVHLLLLRAVKDNDKIFMLVHVDQLSHDIAQQVEDDIHKTLQGNSEYRLVVFCCSERQDKCALVPALYDYRVDKIIEYKTEEIIGYVQDHLKTSDAELENGEMNRSSVVIVQSHRAGVGKTLWVRNRKAQHTDMKFVGLPLHGKTLDIPAMVNRMCQHTPSPESDQKSFFHIDIPHEMNMGVDQLLFELVILRSLSDPKGYLWARSERDLYVIEVMPLLRREVQPGLKGDAGTRPVHHMLELLPTITCQAPRECLQAMETQRDSVTADSSEIVMLSDNVVLMDEHHFKSPPFQRVYQLLLLLKKKKDLQGFKLEGVKGDMKECLQMLTEHCQIDNPSWAEINYFVDFLNKQWCQCEGYHSNLRGLNEFVVRAMLQMSKDFIGRSLEIADGIARHDDMDREAVEQYELKRKWKASANPYVFFTPDGQSLKFLGYHVDKDTMDLLDPHTKERLIEKVMNRDLFESLEAIGADLEEDLDELTREEQLEKLCNVIGVQKHDPDPNYVLTSDNIKKMLAIYMRFRCQIPVIVMGESGCGKTYLVNFLCRLQKPPNPPQPEREQPQHPKDPLNQPQQEPEPPQPPKAVDIKNRFVLKVHGNVKEEEIIEKIKEAESQAKINHARYPGLFTVVFLDEVNTTEALSLVKEVLCDHTINGEPLDMDSGLRFVAACNPYKRHSKEMIKKMEEGGLGYHVRSDKASDRFGHTPMRHLVYRVEPLPQSLLPLVWDFGQLDDETEKLYIDKIVDKHFQDNETLKDFDKVAQKTVAEILHASQCYMRSRQDECSHVSLRDPERVLIVMEWFYTRRKELKTFTTECPDQKTWALVMALGVCYHAALGTARKEYRNHIVKYFKGPLDLNENGQEIANVIDSCQAKFVDKLELQPTIAKNEALKENIFMMVVCMELRIPLFIVGKPGSSKSLSRQILANEMNGQSSTSELYKSLKRVQMTVYQCSPLSSAEGIIDVFQTCVAMQEKNDLEEFVSVVVLDEVGLAEDTPEMPLKSLHHLLEQDRDGEEHAKAHKKVGFLGLSNWSLDPAKNNRALMVRRNTPDRMALKDTAMTLCKTQKMKMHLGSHMARMAQGYFLLYDKAMKGKEFFGLRDFYSLVKMLYAFAEKNDRKPNEQEVTHAILRNFGGVPEFDALEPFTRSNESKIKAKENNSATDLIRANLKKTKIQLESRHLLLLTENQAALSIVQEHFDVLRDAVIIFGSSFPNDLEFTKLCRAINRVKLCMESGKTVILLNQEPIFESLYDALNQYYTYFGGEKHVDIGLGSQRMKCKVHEDFKLVVVADSETVHKDFPIPLINRFEKHYLSTSSVLNKAQCGVIKKLERWIQDFVMKDPDQEKRGHELTIYPGDIFIGYHKEAPSSIVLQVCKELGEQEGDEKWRKEVMKESKKKLLLCATPESIILVNETSLKEEAETIQGMYLREQKHESLSEFLGARMSLQHDVNDTFIQVTTHSRLLPKDNLEVLGRLFKKEVLTHIESIQSFVTEHDFSEMIKSFYHQESETEDDLLIVQCDSGNEHQDLLACCRYIITDEHHKLVAETPRPQHRARKHVVLVVHLPRLAGGCFTGFQMQPWECVHIEELHPYHQMPPIQALLKNPVSAVLRPPGQHEGHSQRDPKLGHDHDFQKLFESCIIEAMSILKDGSKEGNLSADNKHANISRVDNLNNVLQQLDEHDLTEFLGVMRKRIYLLQVDRESKHEKDEHKNWLSKVATTSREMKMLTFTSQVRQYIQKKMTGLVAGIIAFADSNNNLNILLKEDEPWKKHMWLNMLNDEIAINLSIKEDLGQSEPQEIPVKSHGANGSKMEVCMPFSWVIFKCIDGCIKEQRTDPLEAALLVSNMKNNVCTLMVEALKENADEEEVKKRVVENYLSDFVAMVYKAPTTEDQFECKLVEDEINRQYSTLLNKTQKTDVKQHVPLIHAAYAQIQSRIELFSQIVQGYPEVLQRMKDESAKDKAPQHMNQKPANDEDLQGMTEISANDDNLLESQRDRQLNLELRAVHHALVLMQPTSDQLRDTTDSKAWYERTGRMTPLINQVFSVDQDDDAQMNSTSEQIEELMNKWERILTVRMFASVVFPPKSDQSNMQLLCPILWETLREKPNMKTKETMDEVDTFFKSISKIQRDDLLLPCSLCAKDLIEVYLLPCGHDVCIPCTELQKKVAGHDFACIKCKEKFSEKSILEKRFSSGEQKLRSFKNLLQSFRMELVSRVCLSGPTVPEDELIELLLNNITDSDAENVMLDQKMKAVMLQLLWSLDSSKVKEHFDLVFMTPETIIGHHMELAMLFVQCVEDTKHITNNNNDEGTMRDIAAMLKGNFKALRRRSLDTAILEAIALTRFCLSETADWLEKIYINKIPITSDTLPDELQRALKEVCTDKSSWPWKFLMKVLVRRFGIDVTVRLSNIQELEWLKDKELSAKDTYTEVDPFVLYGDGYKEVREYMSQSLSIDDDININGWQEAMEGKPSGNVDQILVLVLMREAKTRSQLQTAKGLANFKAAAEKTMQTDMLLKLLDDAFAVNCDKFNFSNTMMDAKDHKLRDILLHFYITMRSTPTITVLEPFKHLIHRPADMKGAFLPAAVQDSTCDEYENDVAIGHQRLSSSSIRSSGKRVQDSNEGGQILNVTVDQPAAVRRLSLLQTNVIRLLFHMSLYLGANQHVEDICSLIDPAVHQKDVPDTLWRQLHHDLSVFTETMGIDDAVLLIHTIIIKMTEFRDRKTALNDPLLKTKGATEIWEDSFTADVLSKILSEKEDVLDRAHRHIAGDHTLGKIGELLKMVYEADIDEENHPVNKAVMWRYRLQVTFQTAAQKLAELRYGDHTKHGEGGQHELLYYFMQKEPLLQKVQLLPRIIKFQKLLQQKYDHKITQKEAKETKIGHFLTSKSNEGDEECKELFRDYQQVWNIPRQFKTRKDVDESTFEPLEIETTLDKFLPECDVLVVLVNIHNALIKQLENTGYRTCNLGPDVNLLNVKPTHLVTYDPDKDLLPLVTANCSSSLKLGEGTKVEYDFDNMEYQLIERLFEGKSLIIKQETTMVFSDNLTTVHKLGHLKEKIPQTSFSPAVETQLRQDTKYTGDVYDLVANLDIAIGFLHTVGGNPERHLESFMREDLKMDPAPLPRTTKEHCQFKHIRALWLLMSNEREKHAARLGAVPFATPNEDGYDCYRQLLKDEQKEPLRKGLVHTPKMEKLLMELFTCITLNILKNEVSTKDKLTDHMTETKADVAALKMPDGVGPILVSQCMYTWRAVYDFSREMEMK